MHVNRVSIAVGALAAGLVLASDGRAIDGAGTVYRCNEMRGVNMSAPSWTPERDGFSGANVLLMFNGKGNPGHVRWSNATRTYPGLGFTMNSGFGLILFGEEFLEVYVVNVSNQELLVTMTRSGSASLPNSVKAFRGRCIPAGNNARAP